MAKTSKATHGKYAVKASPVGAKVVRNAKTGQSVTVKGFGALKDDTFKIKKGVSLLKPIAQQVLAKRPAKRKLEIARVENRKAG